MRTNTHHVPGRRLVQTLQLVSTGALALIAAMTAPAALAVPVLLDGLIYVSTDRNCSPWCGGTEAQSTITGSGGQIVDGQFEGGGGAVTSAILGGGGWLGKTAASTASFDWRAIVRPAALTSDPFHLYLDWQTMLSSSHDKLLGSTDGGSQFRVTWYECLPSALGCTLTQMIDHTRVYKGSIALSDTWDLGEFDPSIIPLGELDISFDVGSMAATLPLVGIYASAIDVGTFNFTLRADDGHTMDIDEPPMLALVMAGLVAAQALSARPKRKNRGQVLN